MPYKEIMLEGGSRTRVVKKGNTILRDAGPWSVSVLSLLAHLEAEGFEGSPRVMGSGFDKKGREMLSYIDGEIVHPAPWSDEGAIAIGGLLRKLHDATSTFKPPRNAIWRGWHGRSLRGSKMVFGHCDLAPWNIISKQGIPFAVIDWETAGPVDAMIELAQVCWLNAQLCDDDIAERAGLKSADIRANQLKLIVEAYGLPKIDRDNLLDALIEISVCDAADQAIEANVLPETTDIEPLWALSWRTRSAAWIIRNQPLLRKALQ